MKMTYMLVKKKNDFCQTIDQLKKLLASNVRIEFVSEEVLKAGRSNLYYKISLKEVEVARELVFYVEVTAKQDNDADRVEALETFDEILRRVNNHYEEFQINTVWDERSLYYGRRLYPKISELEALLREIIYRFMINNAGSQWLKKRTPPKVQDELNNTARKNKIEKIETDPLIYADFIVLGYFFFSKYSLEMDNSKMFEVLKNKDNHTEEKINKLIEQYEPRSNWDRYFSEKIPIDNLFNKWEELYEYRNQVAHTKRINKSDYLAAEKIIKELKSGFLECLNHLDDVELTEEQFEAVEEFAEKTISTVGNMGDSWHHNQQILASMSRAAIKSYNPRRSAIITARSLERKYFDNNDELLND